MIVKERQLQKISPAQRTSSYLGRSSRYGCREKPETHCPGSRIHRRFPKAIRHSAAEFRTAAKKWSIFISYNGYADPLNSEFDALTKRWREETFYLSSVSEICMHPAYQTIMAMGKDALPFILEDLKKQIDHWFYALKFIAREDIGEGASNLDEARQLWLAWGRKQKYIS